MNEHYGMAHSATLFQSVTESQVIIILQSHTTKNDDINLCLKSDTSKKFIVWLTRDREDWELLALNQCIKYIDHWDTGTNHVLRYNTLRWVEGRTADIDHVLLQSWSVISWNTSTIEDTAQEMIREGYLHRSAQELNGIRCADTLCTCENLERYTISIQLNYICITIAYQSQITITDALSSDGNYVTDDGFNFCIYFLHRRPPTLTPWLYRNQ